MMAVHSSLSSLFLSLILQYSWLFHHPCFLFVSPELSFSFSPCLFFRNPSFFVFNPSVRPFLLCHSPPVTFISVELVFQLLCLLELLLVTASLSLPCVSPYFSSSTCLPQPLHPWLSVFLIYVFEVSVYLLRLVFPVSLLSCIFSLCLILASLSSSSLLCDSPGHFSVMEN